VPKIFVSYAPNREDVVIWRALGHVDAGRYIDVGVESPQQSSATFALYEHGWRGVCVASSATDSDELLRSRPHDSVVAADAGPAAVHTMLSQNGGAVGEHTVHLLRVKAGQVEPRALDSLDLLDWEPWVLVVAADTESSGELQEWLSRAGRAGYQLRLFDGVSRFFVAPAQVDVLGDALSYPACTRDHFVVTQQLMTEARIQELERVSAEQAQAVDELTSQLVRWRGEVLDHWVAACTSSPQASAELEAMRATVSWRVTKPFRVVRRAIGSGR
jgi:hypothetical protein